MMQTSMMAIGIVFTFIFLHPIYGQATLLETRLNYQNITPLCPLKEFCVNRTDEVFSPIYSRCQCDEMCSFYEDCCRDSPFFSPTDEPKTNFTCVDLQVAPRGNIRIKMIAHCPLDADAEEHRLCEKPTESFLLSRVPITIMAQNISVTYSSVYCASCNIVFSPDDDYYLWNTTLVCPWNSSVSKIFPDDAEAVWIPAINGYQYTERNLTLECIKRVILPESWVLPLQHVQCHPSEDYFDHCPEDWPDPTEARLCKSYTAPVWASYFRLYKNQHCRKCTGGNPQYIFCYWSIRPISVRKGTPTKPKQQKKPTSTDYSEYTVILRYVRSECGAGAHYDAILKECIQLFPPRVAHHRREVIPIDTCALVTLSAKHFELSPDNGTVIVPKYERNFSQGHYRLTKDGDVEICAKDIPQESPSILSVIISIVTIVGLSLSIVFLLLHICAVVLVSELRNLSGITLASLCVALLGGYISFIVGSTLIEKSFSMCYTSAIVTYVFFMASFFWMLVLAFDVSKVVRLSVRKFRTRRGFKWRSFTVYSAIAWGIPIILGVAAYFVDQAAPGRVDDRFRPNFALHGCWFDNPNSLLVFFLIPLAVIMVLNFSFFVYASVVTSENSESRRKNLRVYVKLTILLGLSWIGGLLASALDSDILWIIFSFLNTLHGVFIFFSFTFTSKVSKSLSKHLSYFRKPRNQTPPECTNQETSFSTNMTSRSQNSIPT